MSDNKIIVCDVTDEIIISGFGNDEGNLGLLKYTNEEISNMIKENNNQDDNIRLAKSLLDTIRNQQQKIEKAIDKLYCWGEVLDPKFQKEMLEILGENNE